MFIIDHHDHNHSSSVSYLVVEGGGRVSLPLQLYEREGYHPPAPREAPIIVITFPLQPVTIIAKRLPWLAVHQKKLLLDRSMAMGMVKSDGNGTSDMSMQSTKQSMQSRFTISKCNPRMTNRSDIEYGIPVISNIV